MKGREGGERVSRVRLLGPDEASFAVSRRSFKVIEDEIIFSLNLVSGSFLSSVSMAVQLALFFYILQAINPGLAVLHFASGFEWFPRGHAIFSKL